MINLFKNLRLFRNYILKIQWGIQFFYFFNTDQNAPIFFKTSNDIALYQEAAFKTDFGRREVPALENMHFHFHAFFPVQAPPEDQNQFKKQFSNKVLFNLCFGQYLKKSKNGPTHPTSIRHCWLPEMLSLLACHMHFKQFPAAVTECWAGFQDEKREG